MSSLISELKTISDLQLELDKRQTVLESREQVIEKLGQRIVSQEQMLKILVIAFRSCLIQISKQVCISSQKVNSKTLYGFADLYQMFLDYETLLHQYSVTELQSPS